MIWLPRDLRASVRSRPTKGVIKIHFDAIIVVLGVVDFGLVAHDHLGGVLVVAMSSLFDVLFDVFAESL